MILNIKDFLLWQIIKAKLKCRIHHTKQQLLDQHTRSALSGNKIADIFVSMLTRQKFNQKDFSTSVHQ